MTEFRKVARAGNTPDGASVDASQRVADQIVARLADLTRKEKQIADALLSNYPMLGMETIASFGERAGVSGPSVLRFVTKLGFSGYAEFQKALRSEVEQRLHSPLTQIRKERNWEGTQDLFAKFGGHMADDMAAFFEQLDRATFDALVSRLADAHRRVFVLGGRYTRLAAQYLVLHLRETRANVNLIDDSDMARADLLADFTDRDFLVVFDFRRYQRDVIEFSRLARAHGCEIALVTDPWRSPISSVAEHVISCPVDTPTSPFDTIVPAIAFTEALAAAVIKRTGAAGRKRLEQLEAVRRQFSMDGEVSEKTRKGRKS